jgi:hypothetical protein
MPPDSDGIRLGKTFSFTWEIFQNNLLSLLALSSLYTLPGFFLQVYLQLNPIQPENLRAGLTTLLVVLVFVIIASCLALVSSLAMPVLIENSVLDREVSLENSLKRGVAKFMTGAVAALIASLIIFGLSLLLVIPGIIWMYYYIFLNEAVALRDLRGMEGLRYSKHLVKGRWWNVFWIVLVCCCLLTILVALPTALTALFLGESLLAHAVQLVLSTFAFAFFHVMRTLMFLALECSKGLGVARVPQE